MKQSKRQVMDRILNSDNPEAKARELGSHGGKKAHRILAWVTIHGPLDVWVMTAANYWHPATERERSILFRKNRILFEEEQSEKEA